MGWNHRILAQELEGETYCAIHEVYYDENGVPSGYTADPVWVLGSSLKDIKWALRRMTEATKKPILSINNFPNEYKP
jgi:hypothetical protein